MIEQHEVDGVPMLLARADGPTRAGLIFRVGQADETLARKGITHLIEHLALFSFGASDYHYNGATGNVQTVFHMQGEPDEITTFFQGVCTSLRDLPMTRLATEKEILRTEESTRGGGVGDGLALWRHGARDYGLSAYPEWGLRTLREDDLRAWVARYFTRENAVLWIRGEGIPAGLRLDLPTGTRVPAPEPSSALPVTPAHFVGHANVLGWDSVVPRVQKSSVFAEVLERRMFRELRQEAGLSYTASVAYRPHAAGTALITAVADALPEKSAALLGGFVDLMAALRVGRITDDEVASAIGKRVDLLRRSEPDRVARQALGLLLGEPLKQLDEVLAATRAVTRDDVAEAAAEAYGNGLLMTPSGGRAGWAGYVAAPSRSDTAVTGTSHRAAADRNHRLVAGPEGVTLIAGDELATVRFDALAVMLAWPDGGRRLIGHDAMVVNVEPSLFRGLAAGLSAIDRRVPRDLRIDLPPRSPGEIPRPTRVPWRLRLRARLRVPQVAILKLVLPHASLSVLCLAFAVAIAVAGFRGDRAVPSVAAFGVLLLAAVRYARRVGAVLRAMR